MVKQSIVLDPNAEPNVGEEYTTGEKTKLTGIEAGAEANVGEEFSTAEQTKLSGIEVGAEVNPADLDEVPDSATRKAMSSTEKTKLTGIEDGAEVNVGEEFSTSEQTKLAGVEAGAKDDQTGAEVRDLVLGLSDTERGLVTTDPATGQFKVISIERKADGKINVQYDDVAEP